MEPRRPGGGAGTPCTKIRGAGDVAQARAPDRRAVLQRQGRGLDRKLVRPTSFDVRVNCFGAAQRARRSFRSRSRLDLHQVIAPPFIGATAPGAFRFGRRPGENRGSREDGNRRAARWKARTLCGGTCAFARHSSQGGSGRRRTCRTRPTTYADPSGPSGNGRPTITASSQPKAMRSPSGAPGGPPGVGCAAGADRSPLKPVSRISLRREAFRQAWPAQ
jgi:hypothetical protein